MPRPFTGARFCDDQDGHRRGFRQAARSDLQRVFANGGCGASLAQVHRARLVDGREVAVKVQYPDIENIIRTDLSASRRVATIYRRFDSNPMDFLPLLDEMQRHLKMELDFRREAASAERIRSFFLNDPTVGIRRSCTTSARAASSRWSLSSASK